MSRHHRRLNNRRLAVHAAFVKERAGYRCERCGKACRLEADHVTPLDAYPSQDPYDPDGCQALCVGCHRAKARAENRRADVDPDRERWRAYLAALS